MCGILGLYKVNQHPLSVRNFHLSSLSIRHRGPDDEGYLLADMSGKNVIACRGPDSDPGLVLPDITSFYDKPFSLAFGFRRLSILDLSASGHQPMSTADRRYWIVFNGEIYNYLELKGELIKLGHQFTSTSDTEVLLNGYVQWGNRILNKLVGMFAFAILDLDKRILFLARDFFGIKPLYYVEKNEIFAFASEAKALLELDQVDRLADPQAVYLYLRHGLTDHDETSLWKDIRKLPPAHFLEISLDAPGKAEPQRYWQLERDRHLDVPFVDATTHLRNLFMQSIRLHLRSDVPVGAALSGGIDSSAIVAAMRQIEGQELDLLTFSYVADDPALSEESWADLAGQSSGAKIYKTFFSVPDLMQDIDTLIYALDEPFDGTSIYAQYCVFRLAHQNHIKVMLDGQGADELLGGYASYISAKFVSLLSGGKLGQAFSLLHNGWRRSDLGGMRILLRAAGLMTPESLRNLGQSLIGMELFPAWMNVSWFKNQGVGGSSIISMTRLSNTQALRSLLYQTFTKTSLPMLLRYEDHNSMAHSIESRVPFLTPEIANFIFSLPEDHIIDREGRTKSVFRAAMRGIVPDPILDRRDKIGFQTPEKSLLKSLRPWTEKVLNSDRLRDIPVFNTRLMKREYSQMLDGNRKFDHRFWRWMNFIRWVEIFDVQF